MIRIFSFIFAAPDSVVIITFCTIIKAFLCYEQTTFDCLTIKTSYGTPNTYFLCDYYIIFFTLYKAWLYLL